MNVGANPREELRAAIDGLTEEQARTVLGWLPVLRGKSAALDAAHSVGGFGDLLGIVSEAQEPGLARMRLTVDPAWYNPNGVLHGGVIYTIVDFAMGKAVSSSLEEGEYCATIEIKISYLASVREGALAAEAEVVKQGRRIAFAESRVTDGQGRLVATASGSMFIVRPGSQG